MGSRSRWLTAFMCIAAMPCNPASAQTTTTTNCSVYPNQVNCTSNTQLSAAEQFRQSMTQLGAALVQQQAAKAARQAVWDAAATANAKQAGIIAAANYDATTDALRRYSQDTAASPAAPLNGDLRFDWSVLNYESRIEGPDGNGNQYTGIRRWSWTDTPGGGKVLRMDETGTIAPLNSSQAVENISAMIRFYPPTGFMLRTWDAQPRFATWSPGYEAVLRVGAHAFATRMNGKGFDGTVPPGTLDVTMLSLAVAALQGEVPASFRIWVVDEHGEVVPADFKVLERTTARVPEGPPNSTCVGNSIHAEKRDVVKLTVSGGRPFETWTVLAAAPHLPVTPQVTCRVMR